MRISRRNLCKLLLTTWMVCFLSIATLGMGQNATIGAPPSTASDAVKSTQPDIRTQFDDPFPPASSWVYLPLIRRDQIGLSVNIQNREDSLNFFLNQYLLSENPAINWTGNRSTCDPGTTGQDFRDAVLRRINYFRAMAGVPANVTFSNDYNRLSQAAALMMSVNGQLNHSPPTSWTCYSTDGAQGAGSSNLAMGANSWNAISLYMRDPGDGNYPVGHRRWILYPQTQVMGTGDIPASGGYSATNSLHVFDTHMGDPRPQTRDEFVSWPPPGYVPYQVVYARWSFSLAKADFSKATIFMESNGSSLSVVRENSVNGYGENTLVWIPMGMNNGDNWPKPAVDATYTVHIHNVVVNQQSRDFAYDVIVFNPIP